MSEKEKLQKAIEATIAAGYQLNSEAFEFLSQNSGTTDPVDIINLALQRISDLQEKPFFIEKAFLETLVQKLTVPTMETQRQQQQNRGEYVEIHGPPDVDRDHHHNHRKHDVDDDQKIQQHPWHGCDQRNNDRDDRNRNAEFAPIPGIRERVRVVPNGGCVGL